MKQYVIHLLVLLATGASLFAQTQVTIYNHGQALIKEQISTQLSQGTSVYSREDVAEALIPASVKLAGNDDITVIEQNFQYDLVNQNQLLKKYLEADVTIIQENGDKLNGSLLSFDDRTLVISSKNGIEIIQRDFVGSIRCPAPKGKLYVRPTLEWKLDAAQTGNYDLDLSYLTRGLMWKAEYVAVLSADDKGLNVSSWIDLNNQSGAEYQNAKLKLVAGELNQARPHQSDRAYMESMAVTTRRKAVAVEEREFFEYHLYDVGFPVTLRNKEAKQIQWLSPVDIQVQKRFIFERGSSEYQNLKVKLRFKNDKETGTGIPLPAGTVRLFKRDTDEALELVGEDWLEHTSRDDEVILTLGEAFDIKGKREVTDRRLRQDRYREEDIRITLANRKDEEVSIDVIEHLGWANWQIKNSSHPSEKLDARRAQFIVKVPAESEVVVTYTYYQSYK